jgi:hypothetical protein
LCFAAVPQQQSTFLVPTGLVDRLGSDEGRPETTKDRYGDFKGKKGVGFEGYKKSLYAQDWFDSSPERAVANSLDNEPAITLWPGCRSMISPFSGPVLTSTTRTSLR